MPSSKQKPYLGNILFFLCFYRFRFDEESNSYVEIVEEGLAMINENSEAADEEIRV